MILDLDGTLVDSNDAHAQSWVDALHRHGEEVAFERVRPLIGMGGDWLLSKLIGLEKDSPRGEAIGKTRREIFERDYLPGVKPFSRAGELLGRMRDEGLELALASSSEDELIEKLLALTGAGDAITKRTRASETHRTKPASEPVRAALDLLELAPRDALMLGDTPYDRDASNGAGVSFVGLRCGGWSDPDLSGAIAIYDAPPISSPVSVNRRSARPVEGPPGPRQARLAHESGALPMAAPASPRNSGLEKVMFLAAAPREKTAGPGFPARAGSFLAALLTTRGLEPVAVRAIRHLFRLARVGAAAVKTRGLGAGAFLHELEAAYELSPIASLRLRRGLARFERAYREWELADSLWEEAFFRKGGGRFGNDELQDFEERRRLLSERVLYPRRSLGFLCRQSTIPPIRNRVIPPDEVFSHWAEELWRPRIFYRAPSRDTLVEESRSFCRGEHREYFLRFHSPSNFLDDRVQARVIEPRELSRSIPTVIYCGGLGASYDQVRFWPEEEYVGRRLASRGCRVVLVESPWHGRRSPTGVASGELPLATTPLGILLLISAQAQEVGALVQWARRIPSTAVAVGGISVGAIAMQQVSARCGDWPESLRPDAVFLNGPGLRFDRCGSKGRLLELFSLDERLRRSGWDAAHLALLRPILDPPSPPWVAPESHFVVLGRRNDFPPHVAGAELVRRWGIPDENVLTWDVGHLGLAVRLSRTNEAQERWISILRRVSASRKREARRAPVEPPFASQAPRLGRPV